MKKSYRFILVLVLLVVLGAGWTGLTRRSFSEGGPFVTPQGWPQPVYDFKNNPLSAAGFELGRKLFYDGRLSKDGNFPCASCHQPVAGFADPVSALPVSRGVIKSRSGHLIVLNDKSGSEKIEITDKTGKNKISIESSSNKFSVQVDGDIELKASQGKIVLDAKSVEIKSSSEAKVTAGSTLDLNASSTLTVKGATVNLN